MDEPTDVIEYLDMIRKNGSKKERAFEDISWYLEQRARDQGIPIHGQFELTPLCNFDCKMCYTHLTPGQMKGRSLLNVGQWKELIRQAWEAGMYKTTLTGGECLTYPGFEEIYLFLHSLGCEVHVLSNGILMNDRWINFFKEHIPASIQITLYGNNNTCYENVTGHRAFDIAYRHIDKIKQAGLPLRIAVTPNRYMGEAVYDTIRLAKSLCSSVEVNSGLFSPREETGRSRQNDDLGTDEYIKIFRLVEELDGFEVREVPDHMLPEPGCKAKDGVVRGLGCGGGRSCFVIDWTGRLVPCNELEQIYAEPLKDGFKNAWNKINEVCSNWPCPAECEECPYRSVCKNCAAEMLHYAEPGLRPARLCEKTREMVKFGVFRIPGCE